MVRQIQFPTVVEPLDTSPGYLDIGTKFDFYMPTQQPTYRKGHHPAIYGRDRTTQPIKEDIESAVSQFMDWYRPVSIPMELQARRCRSLSGFFESRPISFVDGTDAVAASMTWFRPMSIPYRPRVLPRLFLQQSTDPIIPQQGGAFLASVGSQPTYDCSDLGSRAEYSGVLYTEP